MDLDLDVMSIKFEDARSMSGLSIEEVQCYCQVCFGFELQTDRMMKTTSCFN